MGVLSFAVTGCVFEGSPLVRGMANSTSGRRGSYKQIATQDEVQNCVIMSSM